MNMARYVRTGPIVAVILTVVLLLGLAGCRAFTSKETATQGPPTLKYIINNLGGISTIDIALEKGFFDEQGVKVETVGVAGGGSPSVEAILSGSADIGGAAMPTYVNAVKAGSKLKIIYGGPSMGNARDPGTYWIVRKDSGINGPADLAGKTIAMGARGAIWEYGTKEYLRKSGLSADQVSIILVPPPQQEQVLMSHQADVVVLTSPFADKILENGQTKLLTSIYDILGETRAGGGFGIVARQDLIDKNPETVKKVVAALLKADEWAAGNPEEAKKLAETILKKREQNPLVAKYWKVPVLRNHGQLIDEDVQFWIDWFIQEGKLKPGVIKPSDIYTNEFNPYYQK